MDIQPFQLVSKFQPAGDQPEAISRLCEGIEDGLASQVLLGVTGSGKTFTMANVIAKVNRPALVIAHNKILAAQLCNELREFFPHNRVEFFVSYYDYYQPEAYIVSSDTYIEKDMAVNEEIDRLRNSATASLLERSDTIVVASVSCIYGLGNPEEYENLQVSLRTGQTITREKVIKHLIAIQYTRNEIDFHRTTFRAKGDVLEVFPSNYHEHAVRIDFFGNEIESISEFDVLTGKPVKSLSHISIFPATHYAVGSKRLEGALSQIAADRDNEVAAFEQQGKLIEAQRLRERVTYDMEMMREVGFCSGIENYSRYFDGRKEGEPPFTLMDYFPENYLTIIDESHMTIPQVRAMFAGDRARKTNLVDYGFRLEASFDNRPLNFSEFNRKLGQCLYVSATPAEYEKQKAGQIVEQLIRPTGLLDPVVQVFPSAGQIDKIVEECRTANGRILITTLTKRMAEDLTTYLGERGIRVRYLHSEIETMERIEILSGLRMGEFDVLVGINLLREGLDLPEVKLVMILDADKEGFLRSEQALIQTIGRAARNSEGRVLLFADKTTAAMENAMRETARRREIQDEFNQKHGIIPQTIIKEIKNTLQISKRFEINYDTAKKKVKEKMKEISILDLPTRIEHLTMMMKEASVRLDFEAAIELRNEINELKKRAK